VLVLAASLGGCLSIADASRGEGWRLYGGVRHWFGSGGNGWQMFLWFTVVAPVVDIPLCLVFDTLTIPAAVFNPRDAPQPYAPPVPSASPTASELAVNRAYPDLERFDRPRRPGPTLGPGIYEGTLGVGIDVGSVKGAGVGRTVIEGDLVVVGSNKSVRDMTVLGDTIVSGRGLDLSGCELKGKVRVDGAGNSLPPGTVFHIAPEGTQRVVVGALAPRVFALGSKRLELGVRLEAPGPGLAPVSAELLLTNVGSEDFVPVVFYESKPGTRETAGWLGTLEPRHSVARRIKLRGPLTWKQLSVETRAGQRRLVVDEKPR
jgi:uncharacterized protein YceK